MFTYHRLCSVDLTGIKPLVSMPVGVSRGKLAEVPPSPKVKIGVKPVLVTGVRPVLCPKRSKPPKPAVGV